MDSKIYFRAIGNLVHELKTEKDEDKKREYAKEAIDLLNELEDKVNNGVLDDVIKRKKDCDKHHWVPDGNGTYFCLKCNTTDGDYVL